MFPLIPPKVEARVGYPFDAPIIFIHVQSIQLRIEGVAAEGEKGSSPLACSLKILNLANGLKDDHSPGHVNFNDASFHNAQHAQLVLKVIGKEQLSAKAKRENISDVAVCIIILRNGDVRKGLKDLAREYPWKFTLMEIEGTEKK